MFREINELYIILWQFISEIQEMKTITQIQQMIKALPEYQQKAMLDFVKGLLSKASEKEEQGSKTRIFGYAAGFFEVGDDFDEPISFS